MRPKSRDGCEEQGAIEERTKELTKKIEELEDAREEKNKLIKKLEWKDEELQHERMAN